MVASTSTDRASLARVQSWRSRARATTVFGSLMVEFGQRPAGEVVDVGEDGVVEVRAPQSLDPLGRPDDLEAVRRAAEDRRVEGAASEVVDRKDVTLAERAGGGVVRGRRLGLRGVERAR